VGAEEETVDTGDGGRSVTYHAVVQFTAADGRTVKLTSGVGFGCQPEVGRAVPVRYRREDPEQAAIDRGVFTWLLPAAFWLLVGLGLLVTGAVVATEEPQVGPAVDNLEDPGTVEPALESAPPARVETGRIGDKLTVNDRSGEPQFEVTVTRLKFSTGDQVVPPPERGWYMGVHVKAHALADEQHLLIEALVGGHHYDEYILISSTDFQPLLDSDDDLSLNKAERSSGWLVFDVPAQHGQLVLRNVDRHEVVIWTY
jgi:Protein of unknown function (DUF3592)